MSEFYTNIFQSGNKMLVRGIKNGSAYNKKIDFYPTLYVPSKGSNPQWKSLDGKLLDEIKPGTIKDTREFIDKYKDVSGFEIYGNTNYICQFISESYPGEIQWDKKEVRITIIDIEVASENGFPRIEQAAEEVLLISLKDFNTKDKITFGRGEYTGTDLNNIKCYRAFKSEAELLEAFLEYWRLWYPDVITGWNTNLFDIPYLVRRITNVLGEKAAQLMSPWGSIHEREVHVKNSNRKELAYTLNGISILDYLELYQKYTYSKQESYTLGYIASVELSEQKLDHSEYDNFRDFYTKDWNKFVEYNIRDVELVDRMEEKKKFIELMMTIAYGAKINYDTVYSQVNMWDAIIYNNLREKHIAIPQKTGHRKDSQFEGAYVKEPIPKMYKWVVSFDAASLYPSIMQTYNISPETFESVIPDISVDNLLQNKFKIPGDYALCANGAIFKRDKPGMFGDLIDVYIKKRKDAKKTMLQLSTQIEQEKDKNKKEQLSKQKDSFDVAQMAYKIALNSLYGAAGNEWFRYFDIEIARAVTLTGQYIIQCVEHGVNDYLNKMLKTQNIQYVFYCDTDSVYITLDKIIDQFYSNKTTEQKIKIMDQFCKDKLGKEIERICEELQVATNAFRHNIIFKREALGDIGIWTAKKRYILNVHNSEDVQYAEPKLKVMGLEMVKSSTPAIVRKKLKEALKVIVSGTESDVVKFIDKFKQEFITMKPEEIAFPRSVNGVKEYAGSPVYRKGTPIHVRGVLLFNHYLNKYNLTNKYPLIRDGDKIKFIYLMEPNPIHEDVISFVSELPKNFGLEKYIDYEKQFEKTFLDPLKIILDPIGWKVEQTASLEEFFG